MSNITCESDFDCPGSLRCVTKEALWTDQMNFCTCFGYYGYTGKDCTEKGPQTYWAITTLSIMILICGVYILLCFRDMFGFLTRRIKLKFNATFVSWFHSTMGLILFLIWRVLLLVTALDPELHKTRIEDESVSTKGMKTQKYNFVNRLISSIIFAFTVCALLSVSIMWLEVAYRAKQLIVKDSKLIKKYYRVNYSIQAIFITMIIIMLALDEQGLIAVTSLPFIIGIIITYSIGQRRISKVLNDMITRSSKDERVAIAVSSEDLREKESPYKKILSNVNRTAIIILLALCITIFAALGMFLFDPKFLGDLTAPGEISLYYLCGDVFSICNMALLITISNYTRTSWNDTAATSSKGSGSRRFGSKSKKSLTAPNTRSKTSEFEITIDNSNSMVSL